MEFRSIETFCAGRNGTQGPHNEDLAVAYSSQGGHILAVIDGVTATTTWTQRNAFARGNVTSGWLAGQEVDHIIRQVLAGIPHTCTHLQFLEMVFQAWQNIRRRPGFPNDELAGTAYAIYVPWANGGRGEVWALADCLYGFLLEDGTWHASVSKPPISRDARLRQNAVETLLTQRRAQTKAELARYGREDMQRQRARLVRASGTWLDSMERVCKRMVTVPVPDGVRTMVLATDGFIVTPRTIQEGLNNLADWRQRDPLCIGRNGGLCTAKGFVDEATGDILPFTDDVGIVVATV